MLSFIEILNEGKKPYYAFKGEPDKLENISADKFEENLLVINDLFESEEVFAVMKYYGDEKELSKVDKVLSKIWDDCLINYKDSKASKVSKKSKKLKESFRDSVDVIEDLVDDAKRALTQIDSAIIQEYKLKRTMKMFESVIKTISRNADNIVDDVDRDGADDEYENYVRNHRA